MDEPAELDVEYVLDLCEEVIGASAVRNATFPWLRSGPSLSHPRGTRLPVHGFWPEHSLIAEFCEERDSALPLSSDRSSTKSGVDRDPQWRASAEHKADLLTARGIRLARIEEGSFAPTPRGMARDRARDLTVVERNLGEVQLTSPEQDPPEERGEEVPTAVADRETVADERDQLRTFMEQFSRADLVSGDWFPRLLAFSLDTYTKKVDAQYFLEKYPGVLPDAIVDQRVRVAARYAGIEGFLSASAYNGAVAATIGKRGGASSITGPAALGTMTIDLAYLSQLQIRLAYDIAVIYGVPPDLDDPEDLWNLIRVAFTIKGGDLAREGATKFAPAVVRQLVKKYYAGPVLNAAKDLPLVGRVLLQRNVIKIGIPLIGIPLAV